MATSRAGCSAAAPFKRALLLLLQCIGTNLDQDLSADVVFGSFFRLHVNNAR